MADDNEEFFVPIVDEDGRVTGVMDQMTADYLASTEPDPTQASLDAAFDGVTRVRLVGPPDEVHVDVGDAAEIGELARVLQIVEADEYGHLMSPGLNRLEMWAGDRVVHTLELPDWDTIRWPSVWAGDATLADPRRFADWLQRHGFEDALEDLDDDDERYADSLQARQDWERAMPPSLRPLWPDRLDDEMSQADIETARALLEAAVPDPVERVRALYTWFGSGEGPWSGYPSYEGAAELLLLAYPIEILLAALDTSTDNPFEVYGAARLFGGWDFGKTRGADRMRCPEPLRQRMLESVIWHGNRDNVRRFRSAFDLPDR